MKSKFLCCQQTHLNSKQNPNTLQESLPSDFKAGEEQEQQEHKSKCQNPSPLVQVNPKILQFSVRMKTYFPSAKHSSFTVEPLAAARVSGNWTSILGSYSPITPGGDNGESQFSKVIFEGLSFSVLQFKIKFISMTIFLEREEQWDQGQS